MPTYAKLSVDIEAYYSGSTYYEELYLPYEIWKEIEEKIDRTIYVSELDGKYSESSGDIEVEYLSDLDLENMVVKEYFDGEQLFYTVDEYLDSDFNLELFQESIRKISKVKELTIMIHMEDEEKINDLLKDYIIGVN